MNRDWYKDFFHGVTMDFWRLGMAPVTPEEVAFLRRHLNIKPGAKLLDVPCGEGRHALELAQQGFRVTGVDLSESNIHAAGENARQLGITLDLHCRDKRELPWSGEFDAAYCLGNSFGYLDDEGMNQFVAAVAKSLKPGARFVIETAMAAESIIVNLDSHWWMKTDDLYVMIENHYLCEESTLHTEMTFVRNGKTEMREFWHRVYTIAEIRTMLKRAGFSLAELFASTEEEPFELGSPQCWILAENQP